MRTKKLPKLDKLMHRQRSRKPQSAEQMLAAVTMLNTLYGGEVKGM